MLKRGSTGSRVALVQKLLAIQTDQVYGPLTEEAVREFQASHGLKADGMVGTKTWAKLVGTMLHPTMTRRIDELIVHCSATRGDKDYTVNDIRAWHLRQGWSDIGYHYVVYRDGTIVPGRNVDVAGAHCVGHNTHSIGICYVGGIDPDTGRSADTRTVMQRESLRELLIQLRGLYPNAKIYGHCDFSAKDCPCFDARREYSDI